MKLCEYNRLVNVVPLNLAVQPVESAVHIKDPNNHIGASIVGTKEGIGVIGTSLEILTEKFGISEIAFIKMNIEGAEKLAIEGMLNCIRNARFASIATHDFITDSGGRDEMRTKSIVLEVCRRNGYKVVMNEHDQRVWIRDHVHGANQRLVDSLADSNT